MTNIVKQRFGKGMNPNSLKNLRPIAKGVSGNPKGRPKKPDCLLDCIKEELSKPCRLNSSLTNEQMIASMLVAQATKGNIKAIELMMSYLHVKPVQRIGIEGAEGKPLLIREVEVRLSGSSNTG